MADHALSPTVPAANASGGLGRIVLKRGREGPVRGRNPWIFSQAIERVEPATLSAGAPVAILDHTGANLGLGYYHPRTTIAVRLLTFGPEQDLDALVRHRLREAIELRRRIVPPDTECYRVVNGDGDGLSGLVVDRYSAVVVVQFLTAGMDRMRAQVIEVLQQQLSPSCIYERSAGSVRKEEGLETRLGLLAGQPMEEVLTRENGYLLAVYPGRGQKTGYFLDQRDNRRRFGALAGDAQVLDACCYTGGFTIAALGGGARHVVAVDSSAVALGWARHNLELNGLATDKVEFVDADVGRYLAASEARFDSIVLDPPPLARSRGEAARAEKLYLELNRLAMRTLAPGGLLMTFSCSVHFRGEDFFRTIRNAQVRAGRNLRLLQHAGAAADHPVMLGHLEGEYLTGALLADCA